jgi:hypothetical protein
MEDYWGGKGNEGAEVKGEVVQNGDVDESAAAVPVMIDDEDIEMIE